MSELPQPSQQFISDYERLHQTAPKRRGGPYTKAEKEKQLREVFKLHIIYGYSATRISEMTQINKRTILDRIQTVYSHLFQEYPLAHISQALDMYIARLEDQRTRLMERLDKEKDPQLKLSIERLLFDVNTRLGNTYDNIVKSWAREESFAAEEVNKFAKKHKIKERYVSRMSLLSLPRPKYDKVMRIFREG